MQSYRIVPLGRLVRTLRRCCVIERVKEALCKPVVVRELHRPFLRRLTDLLSVPPTCQVLSKTFWHLPMPFISYSPSLCSWHSSALKLTCPYFTEAFPVLPIVPSFGIVCLYIFFFFFLFMEHLHFVIVVYL